MWTKEKPTKPGFYWYRYESDDVGPEVAGINDKGDVIFLGEDVLNFGVHDDMEFWSEPLTPPEA